MSLYHNMQSGLSGLLYQYQKDIALISRLQFCAFHLIRNAKRTFKSREGNIVKVAFLLALSIHVQKTKHIPYMF